MKINRMIISLYDDGSNWTVKYNRGERTYEYNMYDSDIARPNFIDRLMELVLEAKAHLFQIIDFCFAHGLPIDDLIICEDGKIAEFSKYSI